MKKDPKVVGVDASNDPVLAKYRKGLADRMAKARADRPKVGNLVAAAETYDPKRDGPLTTAQVVQAQQYMPSRQQGVLSPQSVASMQAVAKATEAARAKRETVTPAPQQPQPQSVKSAVPPKKEVHVEEEKVNLDNYDDLELEQLMRGIQKDVINNKAEREHVDNPENKRISEIDFAEGVAVGEFKQVVDVVPSRLKVHYRTVTALENQAIRLWIFRRVAEDARLERISGEMFGLGLVVASVMQVNGTSYPNHMKQSGAGMYTAEFDEVTFAEKYNMFARMPQPLIHAIGTHGQWFDLRVRKLFTTDFVKNG